MSSGYNDSIKNTANQCPPMSGLELYHEKSLLLILPAIVLELASKNTATILPARVPELASKINREVRPLSSAWVGQPSHPTRDEECRYASLAMSSCRASATVEPPPTSSRGANTCYAYKGLFSCLSLAPSSVHTNRI